MISRQWHDPGHFSAQTLKIRILKKNLLKNNLPYFSQKKFLYFGKWNFLAPSFKIFLYFRRELSKLKKKKKKEIHSEKVNYILSKLTL